MARKYQAKPHNEFAYNWKYIMFADVVTKEVRRSFGLTPWQFQAMVVIAEWQKQLGFCSYKLLRNSFYRVPTAYFKSIQQLYDAELISKYRYLIGTSDKGHRRKRDELFRLTPKGYRVFATWTRRLNNKVHRVETAMDFYRNGKAKDLNLTPD